MKPILYPATENNYTTNGLGVMADAISCRVTEERNGAYELEMEYPQSGIHYAELALERILLAKPNPTDKTQPFRIYRITRPMLGRVFVYAQHISYDLSGVPVVPFAAESAAAAMAGIESNTAVDHGFRFMTDKNTVASFAVTKPQSARACLGGSEGSVLDVFGGELEFDRDQAILHNARGMDRGVSIRYGKNLTDLEQEENCASVATGVYPYYREETDTGNVLVTLPEKILLAEGNYPRQRILTLDCSDAFEEVPTEAQLRAYAQSYMERNQIGVPTVSLTVSFVQLEQTTEYAGKALLERVSLCDTVSVEFPALGVSARAKCIKTVYDTLLERYVTVSLGDARATIADTIVGDRQHTAQQIESVKKDIQSVLASSGANATDWITNGKGFVVIMRNAAGQATEILIMDHPDIETATKVWRWNNGGLGYSKNGYNGPYTTAITQDGAIVADFITAGSLVANIIKAGVLSDINGNFSFDLDGSTITIKDSTGATAFSFTLKDGLMIRKGNLAGFNVEKDEMYAGNLHLNADGYIDAGALRIRADQPLYPEIISEHELSIGASRGVYIGDPDAYALWVGGDRVEICGETINGITRCDDSVSASWSYIPFVRDVPWNASVFVNNTEDNSYSIKTRYSGGWQWCVSGSSGSTYASAFAIW